MALAMKSLFLSRTENFFDSSFPSVDVIPSNCEALHKYDLSYDFEHWLHDLIFPTYEG